MYYDSVDREANRQLTAETDRHMMTDRQLDGT